MPQDPIYTSPQSPAHLRNVLARLQQIIEGINDGSIGSGGTSSVTAAFTSAATAGDAVYADGDGSVDLAIATSYDSSLVVGFAAETVSMGASGTYIPIGVVDLSGLTLTPGTQYFLSPSVAGGITATAPSVAGQYIVPLGVATESGQFSFSPFPPVLI